MAFFRRLTRQDHAPDTTRTRYDTAARLLETAITAQRSHIQSPFFDIKRLRGEPKEFNDSRLASALGMAFGGLRAPDSDRGTVSLNNCREAIQCAFFAWSSFGKTIAKKTNSGGVQSIWTTLRESFALCPRHPFLNESHKQREGSAEISEYLRNKLGALEIAKTWSGSMVESHSMANRVLEVRSALMEYLAINISGQTDERPDGELPRSIDNYNRDMRLVRVGAKITSYEFLKGSFMQLLNENFSGPDSNHRVALYGKAGVGKSQSALHYFSNNRARYKKLFWLTATDQVSLLSSFEGIAQTERLPQQDGPEATAHATKAWLQREDKWLIVIDDLDDFEVIQHYLPKNGIDKHTIIICRSRVVRGLNEKRLEVPSLGPEDAATLLSILSDLSEPHDIEEVLARVQYLPLTIKLSSAYLRQLGTLNARTYCLEFEKTRQDLRHPLRTGDREAVAVATTVTMAIQTIQRSCKPAVDLLRVLSFLNPNGVMIELLISGRKCLSENLRDFIKDETKMRLAWLELAKFGLIKWVETNNTVRLHRIVQRIVRDMMRHNEMMSVFVNVIDMFCSVLPDKVTSKTKPVYRKYQSQILELFLLPSPGWQNFAILSERVGTYFGSIRMFIDCEKLLNEAITIFTKQSADSDCLRVMGILKAAYELQGKRAEVSKIDARMTELFREMQQRRQDAGAVLGALNTTNTLYNIT